MPLDFKPVFQCVEEDATVTDVFYRGYSRMQGERRQVQLEVVTSIDCDSSYDLLLHIARAIVEREDRHKGAPAARDPLTEVALDAAVRVILQHKSINVINSILKVKGAL